MLLVYKTTYENVTFKNMFMDRPKKQNEDSQEVAVIIERDHSVRVRTVEVHAVALVQYLCIVVDDEF